MQAFDLSKQMLRSVSIRPIIAIRSPSREANIKFGHLLADELEQRKDLSFRYILFHQDDEFFETNALLYA